MASSLPAGTTHPRGLPIPQQIRWPLIPARDLFELKYGKALVEAVRRQEMFLCMGVTVAAVDTTKHCSMDRVSYLVAKAKDLSALNGVIVIIGL